MAATPLRFVDLFAGLGGFHVALRRLGHRCVFASEIDTHLQSLYAKNFGLEAHGDIRSVPLHEIPSHDVLCAGFPCQPFSKAGSQKGRKCRRYGTLFDNVIAILEKHQPKYLILENVPNLVCHNRGRTWKQMRQRLEDAGYEIAEKRLFSPPVWHTSNTRSCVYHWLSYRPRALFGGHHLPAKFRHPLCLHWRKSPKIRNRFRSRYASAH